MVDGMLTTPLFAAHQAAGGKIVEFAGYAMPVHYGSVIAEAQAVRQSAGMFDVSHMARLWFRGADVLAFLEQITTNDVSALTDGNGHYSLLPNAQGGCVDDIVLYRVSEGVYRMVVNAANHAKDVAWIRSHMSGDVDLADDTDETVMIAVQGPEAVRLVGSLSPDAGTLAELPVFGACNARVGGVDAFAARSGYTGEDGYELICSAADGELLWNTLAEAGVKPCGLGARDVLRVEAGLPLYGHELDDDRSPIEAGLGWVISKTKTFVGSEPINRAREAGTAKRLVGVVLESKRLAVPGTAVLVDGSEVGEVSSAVYSPVIERGIAFAFVDVGVKLKTACEIDIRGKREAGQIVNKRFLKGRS